MNTTVDTVAYLPSDTVVAVDAPSYLHPLEISAMDPVTNMAIGTSCPAADTLVDPVAVTTVDPAADNSFRAVDIAVDPVEDTTVGEQSPAVDTQVDQGADTAVDPAAVDQFPALDTGVGPAAGITLEAPSLAVNTSVDPAFDMLVDPAVGASYQAVAKTQADTEGPGRLPCSALDTVLDPATIRVSHS